MVSLKGSGDETGKLILSHIEQEAPLLKHLRVTNSSFTELCCFVKAFEKVYYMNIRIISSLVLCSTVNTFARLLLAGPSHSFFFLAMKLPNSGTY